MPKSQPSARPRATQLEHKIAIRFMLKRACVLKAFRRLPPFEVPDEVRAVADKIGWKFN